MAGWNRSTAPSGGSPSRCFSAGGIPSRGRGPTALPGKRIARAEPQCGRRHGRRPSPVLGRRSRPATLPGRRQRRLPHWAGIQSANACPARYGSNAPCAQGRAQRTRGPRAPPRGRRATESGQARLRVPLRFQRRICHDRPQGGTRARFACGNDGFRDPVHRDFSAPGTSPLATFRGGITPEQNTPGAEGLRDACRPLHWRSRKWPAARCQRSRPGEKTGCPCSPHPMLPTNDQPHQ